MKPHSARKVRDPSGRGGVLQSSQRQSLHTRCRNTPLSGLLVFYPNASPPSSPRTFRGFALFLRENGRGKLLLNSGYQTELIWIKKSATIPLSLSFSWKGQVLD